MDKIQKIELSNVDVITIKGDQGIQGIQGVRGEKGDQGLEGRQGKQGEKGDTGDRGPKGDKGDKGDPADETKITKEIFNRVSDRFHTAGNMNRDIRVSSSILSSRYTDINLIGASASDDNVNKRVNITLPSGGGGTPAGSTGDIQINTGGAFDADTGKFTYTKATNKLSNLADYGADISVPLTTGNWTLGGGCAFLTSPDRITKNSNSTGTATSIGITPTVATMYKVVVDVTVTVGFVSVSLGANPPIVSGNSFQNKMDTTGIYTFYIGTADTTGIQFSDNNNLSYRWVINSLSVVPITSGTGDGLFEGDVDVKDLTTNGSTIFSRYRTYLGSNQNNMVIPPCSTVETILSGNISITGIAGGVEGRRITLSNFSPSNVLTLTHQSTSSTDINRFQTSSSSDIRVLYGEKAELIYNGGSLNRWFVSKLTTSAPQFNGLTDGYDFGDWLNTLIKNGEDLSIGTGNSGITISGSTDITYVGDHQNSVNGTRTIWDDSTQTISDEAKVSKQFRDNGNNYVVSKEVVGDGTFPTRQIGFAGNTLIQDGLDLNGTADVSALFEVRSTGADIYRGWLMPRMTDTQRDGIATPADGLQVFITDNNNYTGISTYDAKKGRWVTIFFRDFAVGSLPTGHQNDRAFVNDENGSGFGAVATGGGAIYCPVYFDGTNWRVG